MTYMPMSRNIIVNNEVLCKSNPMHRNVIDAILCRPIIVIHSVYHLFHRNVYDAFFVPANKTIIVVIMNCLPCLQFFYFTIKNDLYSNLLYYSL